MKTIISALLILLSLLQSGCATLYGEKYLTEDEKNVQHHKPDNGEPKRKIRPAALVFDLLTVYFAPLSVGIDFLTGDIYKPTKNTTVDKTIKDIKAKDISEPTNNSNVNNTHPDPSISAKKHNMDAASIMDVKENIKDIFNRLEFNRTLWDLYSYDNSSKYSPIEAVKVPDDIESYIVKGGVYNRVADSLLVKYHISIDLMFQHSFTLFGTDQLGKFFYNKESDIPIRFGLYGDTALSLIVSGIYIDNVYNTLKLSSKQRAERVITTYLLSSLEAYTRNFETNDIKYFGFTAVYGSRDLTSDDPTDRKSEFVAFIAPVNLIRKYVSGDITEDELINAADIYISDRDMVTGIKKIKVTLE